MSEFVCYDWPVSDTRAPRFVKFFDGQPHRVSVRDWDLKNATTLTRRIREAAQKVGYAVRTRTSDEMGYVLVSPKVTS